MKDTVSLDSIPGIILECENALAILRASPSVEHELGYMQNDLIGKSLTDFIHPEDVSSLRSVVSRVFQSANAYPRIAARIRHKNGTWRYLEGKAKGYVYESRQPRIMIHAYDVTRGSKSKARLLESEALQRTTAERSGSAVAVTRNGRYIYVNSRFLELFGLEYPSDIVGRSMDAIAHPDDAWMVAERTILAQRNEEPAAHYEFRGVRRDGEKIVVEVFGARITYRGQPASLSILRDVTAHKNIEAKLRKNEATMRLLFSASPVGIILLGENMAITGINHRINSITGYRPEELLGRDTGILYATDEERLEVEERLYKDVERCGMGSMDTKWVRKAGGIRDVYLNAAAIDPGNVSTGIVMTAVDITERKEAEKRIGESEERYRTAIEESNDGVSLLRGGKHIYVNQRFVKMFGYDCPDEIVGLSISIFVHPDDRQMVADYNRKRNSGEEAPNRYEFKGIRKDGTVIFIEVSITTTIFRGERVALAYLRDITDRKQLEDDLKTREATIRSVLSACPVGVAFADPDRVISLINESMASMAGYRPDDLTGKSARIFYPSQEEFERVGQVSINAFRDNRIGLTETKWVHKDGRLLDIQAYMAAADPGNLSAGMVFTSVDITDRKRMDEALRRSEEKYRNIFERSIEGIFQTNPAGEFISANPALARMHGFDSPEEFLTYVNENGNRSIADMEVLKEYTNTLNEKGFVEGFEMQARKKDGSLIWISVSARRVEDTITRSEYHEGVVEDITARKLTELALRESERRYKSLFEHANDAIFLIKGHRFADCNSRTLEMFRAARADLIGRSVHDFSPVSQANGEDSRETAIAKVQAAYNGCPQSFEWTHIKTDGTPFDVEVSLTVLETRDETLILSIVRDITDRKQAERMLGTALAELEVINAELKNANMELKESQKRIIQQEKMASIGQLAAGVAHEINNPMGFIISNLNSLNKYTKNIAEFMRTEHEAMATIHCQETVIAPVTERRKCLKIDFILEDSPALISESLDGAERVKKIVQDLKSFSRVDSAEYTMADINSIMDSTLNIVWNELKYKATVKKDYGAIPAIACSPGQLGQVFMNILVNASQSIPTMGEISIKTREDHGSILVDISDTGHGIPKEILHRIFEPFYTTKDVGKGTGLGLSIVYDIIKKHKGEIEVTSEEGKGTTFSMKFPSRELESEQSIIVAPGF